LTERVSRTAEEKSKVSMKGFRKWKKKKLPRVLEKRDKEKQEFWILKVKIRP